MTTPLDNPALVLGKTERNPDLVIFKDTPKKKLWALYASFSFI